MNDRGYPGKSGHLCNQDTFSSRQHVRYYTGSIEHSSVLEACMDIQAHSRYGEADRIVCLTIAIFYTIHNIIMLAIRAVSAIRLAASIYIMSYYEMVLSRMCS